MRIHRLPEDLVNKIAAGEVVERPASVVKELVENALDAGARLVHVDIENGGKSLVRVRDDGCGMDRQDAVLALERHATSKLRDLDGLAALSTCGFRGEALPSIASVSELTLRTRTEDDPVGTEVQVKHGRVSHVREAGHPRGTTVEVRDLFGAVPARRKFLRAGTTEAAHVAEAVTLLALARPGIGFFLSSGGRRTLEAPPVDSLSARVYQIFGGALLEELLAVEGGGQGVRVSGFVSRPAFGGGGRPSLRLFVNGRPVRDRAVARGVSEAYRLSGAGQRPYEALLMIDLDAHLVDVNVHPAKAEVRFADPRAVWTAVERAVIGALSAGARASAPPAAAKAILAPAGAGAFLALPAMALGRVAEAAAPEYALGPSGSGTAGLEATGSGVRGLTALGQHRLTYIVASDGVELTLVDQHTAHERVRYELILQQLRRGQPPSQLLLTPVVLTLPPRLLPVLEAHASALRAIGYDVEEFGGGSFRLAAVPALLPADDHAATLTAVLRDLAEREEAGWAVSEPVEKLAATVACHSAVRAGQALNAPAMARLLADLAGAEHASLCPHGRPTMVRIPQTEVARWFGRMGWRRS